MAEEFATKALELKTQIIRGVLRQSQSQTQQQGEAMMHLHSEPSEPST